MGGGRSGAENGAINAAAIALRLTFGLVFLGHGLQKLGWFEGGGYPTSIGTQADFVQIFGYSHTHLMAWLITLTEASTGILLLLGLLTPLAAAGVIGIQWQFLAGVQWSGGLFGNATAGGFEGALMMSAAAVAIGFIGAGKYSLDHRLGWSLKGQRWGFIAIALGVVVGTIVLVGFGVGFGGTPAFAP
jgi:putative oxidoreductase